MDVTDYCCQADTTEACPKDVVSFINFVLAEIDEIYSS